MAPFPQVGILMVLEFTVGILMAPKNKKVKSKKKRCEKCLNRQKWHVSIEMGHGFVVDRYTDGSNFVRRLV